MVALVSQEVNGGRASIGYKRAAYTKAGVSGEKA